MNTDPVVVGILAAVLILYRLRLWHNRNPACGRCRFYDQGACKRYPPARVYVAGASPDSPPVSDVSVWPVVRVENWCGDFERKS